MNKNERVMTYDGILMPKDQTRYIQNEYFIPGKSCFKIANRWYRITSSAIALNVSTNEYDLKSRLTYGIVGHDKSEPKFGYFNKNKYSDLDIIVVLKDGSRHIAINENILENNFVEDISTGIFYELGNPGVKYEHLTKKRKNHYNNIQNGEPNYYTWDNCPFTENVKEYFSNLDLPISNEIKKLSRLIKNLSFGIEFETSNGTMPLRHLYNCGCVVVRDGSVKGYEYTTIPLKGAKGLQAVINFCKHLQKYCTFDTSCSLHIHYGNLREDKLYLLAVYMAAYKIQQEIFELVPYYKKDPVSIIKTEKNYCQPLPSLNIVNDTLIASKSGKEFDTTLDEHYRQLFKFLSGGVEAGAQFNRSKLVHPAGDQKWNQKSRYYFLNIMPMVFGNNRTIEARLHQMTFNPDKIINWLMLNAAFLRFCDSNAKQILQNKLPITVDEVLKGYLDDFMYLNKSTSSYRQNVVNSLKNYFESKRKQFTEEMIRHEYVSNEELYDDNKYQQYSVINSLLDFYGNVIPDKSIEYAKHSKKTSIYDTKGTFGLGLSDKPIIEKRQLRKSPTSKLGTSNSAFYDDDLDYPVLDNGNIGIKTDSGIKTATVKGGLLIEDEVEEKSKKSNFISFSEKLKQDEYQRKYRETYEQLYKNLTEAVVNTKAKVNKKNE